MNGNDLSGYPVYLSMLNLAIRNTRKASYPRIANKDFFAIMERGLGKFVPLKQLAGVKFGIKTGCNEFFILIESSMCFAEITTDNPNVWYELGFAFACKKDVVMVCSEERTGKFPFDIQHRQVITYKTSSKSDFETLEETIEILQVTDYDAKIGEYIIVSFRILYISNFK